MNKTLQIISWACQIFVVGVVLIFVITDKEMPAFVQGFLGLVAVFLVVFSLREDR